MRKADRHGLERLDDVAGRFGSVGNVAAAINVAGRFGSDGDVVSAIDGAATISIANSTVGDEMGSIKSSAGLTITLGLGAEDGTWCK